MASTQSTIMDMNMIDLFEAIASGQLGPSEVAPDLHPHEPRHLKDATESEQASGTRVKRRKRSRSRSRDAAASIHPLSVVSVFSNLMIVEDTLRKRYVDLEKSRRNHAGFFYFMVGLACLLTYVNLVTPSPYRWIRFLEVMLNITIYISLGLFYLTGLYGKTFVVAPRFIHDTNKGLRGLNVRLVKVPPTWRERFWRIIDPVYVVRYGRLVQLVLVPRAFSAHFVELWELYRREFWEKERRRQLKKAKQSGARRKRKSPRPRLSSFSNPTGELDDLHVQQLEL
ncbi:Sporulation-specific protein SPO7 [Wickerhamiella sorbophila]|uniref:Sporulation-specific protein SPO7 n=1 Tax=Wickerhamiella sorbophila TaxID=45607 RepID=A0A2T0FNT3_9ASCO|nr:Sporulation-specific protein SPO7 [Wickerhamiella sorbophila]PRT56638.1 Sporulation-specific protein SPO7 [Wickerhamiella sorbophila]